MPQKPRRKKEAGKAAKAPKKSSKKSPPRRVTPKASPPPPAPSKKASRVVSKHYTGKDLEGVRQMLLEKRSNLLREIKTEMSDSSIDATKVTTDVSDMASDAADGELALRIAETESEEIKQINVALGKLEAGTYGICTNCGNPIGIKRLEALPFASLCVNCKQEEEFNINLQRQATPLHSGFEEEEAEDAPE